MVMIHFPWLTEMFPPLCDLMGFPGGSEVKNPPANTEDKGSTLGLERSPGGRHGNSLQYTITDRYVHQSVECQYKSQFLVAEGNCMTWY